MRQLKRILAVTALTVLILLVAPSKAKADVNDFTVTDFSGDYYLNTSDPQGALAIREKISVDFTDQNHGILRALPEKYNGQPLKVQVKSVEMGNHAEPYTTSTQNGNLVLRIGDPNQTVTGAQTYAISYDVVNVMRFVSDHDELDWNINGDQWSQPFERVSATLHVPAGLATQLANAVCYTGSFGQNGSDCMVQKAADSQTVIYTTTRTLQSSETLTIRSDFSRGTFAAPTLKDWLANHRLQLLTILGLPLLALVLAGGWWWRAGRDAKGRGTIIPEYGPPDNLKPAEVDVVAHFKLSTKAISATIIDLAIRGYIKIIEVDKKKLLGLGKSQSYQLQLLNNNLTALNDYERQIIYDIFGATDGLVGGDASKSTVDLSSLKNKFYRTSKALQSSLPAQLTKLGYFAKNPKWSGYALHIIGGVMLTFGVFTLSLATAGFIPAGLICLLFGFLMPKRTAKGVAAEEAIKGLKLYMEVAEKDRLAMLQSPDAPYAERSNEPVKTVDLFEKLLPYAMVLGVEQQWAKKFENIYLQPPGWYGGNWTTFNAVYFVSALNNSVGAMNSSFAPPRSSGSGMGGGFAGGGGGGGGGGGW